MADTLTATGLTVARGGRELVNSLDLTLSEGTLTALTGPNGCGKTTTARCLGLYDLDFTGTVTVNGTPSSQIRPRDIRQAHRSTIILQPQDLLLEDSWSVTDTLRHAAWALALPRRQRKARIVEVMDRAEISHLARSQAGVLSGGEQMRVALARTLLIPSPQVVILDEPTAGADDELTDFVIARLDDWISAGAAALVSTHDTRIVEHAHQHVRLSPDNTPGDQVHSGT